MSEAASILIADDEGCRVVTLNRPQRRNALGTEVMARLGEALAEAAADPAVGAVVLTGAPPAFCAGSDLKELGALDIAGMAEHEAETAAISRSIGTLDIPVIAAVEGYALGGGCILALSCDLVVTARDVRWSMPEVANGWLPPWGLEALIARVGLVRARSIVWGALDCTGAEAHRLGMADALCEAGDALATAIAMGKRLAQRPASAVISTKRYFAQLRLDAAHLDAVASTHFQQDASSPAAQAVLAKFSGR